MFAIQISQKAYIEQTGIICSLETLMALLASASRRLLIFMQKVVKKYENVVCQISHMVTVLS